MKETTPSTNAIRLATSAWCSDKNAKTVMDIELALEFARIIDQLLLTQCQCKEQPLDKEMD